MPEQQDHVDAMLAAWAEREPDLDASPLRVAGRLLRCAALLRAGLDAALGELGLSFGDFDVVNTIRREDDGAGITPTRLAAAALISSGAMTTRLDRLQARGLIERRPDPADRRGQRIRLTASGEALARRALDAVLAVDRNLIAPLGDHSQQTLAATLRRMLLAAGDAP